MNQLTETQISRISKFWQKLHKLQKEMVRNYDGKYSYEYYKNNHEYLNDYEHKISTIKNKYYQWLDDKQDEWSDMLYNDWLVLQNNYNKASIEFHETYQDLIKYIERLGYNMEDRTVDEELYNLFHGEQ